MKKLLCTVIAIVEMYRVESMEVWSDVYAPRLIARSNFTQMRQDSLKMLDFIKEKPVTPDMISILWSAYKACQGSPESAKILEFIYSKVSNDMNILGTMLLESQCINASQLKKGCDISTIGDAIFLIEKSGNKVSKPLKQVLIDEGFDVQ